MATLAAQSGAAVLLLERFGYDTHRPGEHLPGGLRGALAALGVPTPGDRTIARPSAAIISRWGSAVPQVRGYSSGSAGPALNVDRVRFDAMLLDHAQSEGVSARLGAKLIAADRNGPKWCVSFDQRSVTHSIECGWVIDATGRNAVFARRQGSVPRVAGDLFAVATWFDLDGAFDVPSAALLIEATATGWWSLAQTPAGRAVACHYTSRSLVREAELRPADIAAATLEQAPQIANRLAAACALAVDSRTFACAPALTTPPCGEGWIAIGDAAAAYDPVSGHGAQYAMETAFRAFETVASGADAAALGRLYAEALESRMQDHLTRRHETYLEAGVFDPRFLETAVLAPLSDAPARSETVPA